MWFSVMQMGLERAPLDFAEWRPWESIDEFDAMWRTVGRKGQLDVIP
jgi:hypothetical protein